VESLRCADGPDLRRGRADSRGAGAGAGVGGARVRSAAVGAPSCHGETAEDWDVVAAPMSATRTVFAVNLRGHGASTWSGTYSIQLMADDVAVWLCAHFPAGLVDLVGHSLGGLVACLVTTRCPGQVRRLVLEDVGLLTPRPARPPAKPEGVLAFDWRVVESRYAQRSTASLQPGPTWLRRSRSRRSSSSEAGAARCRRSRSRILFVTFATGRWSPSKPATWCTPADRRSSPRDC